MAVLRSYSAAFEQNDLADAAVTRWRFNEEAGTTAADSIDGLDGTYQGGVQLGLAGGVGDGAARFNGSTALVLVDDALTGTITVSAFGDSLIAGGDIPDTDDRFSPNLETALAALGLDATVINDGVGGNTSAQGLARVDDVLENDPDVVILEFGTNDAIDEIGPATVEANLRAIIAELQDGGVEQILLTGTFGFYPERPAGNLGYDTQELRAEFEGIFAEIAGDTAGVTLLSDGEGSDKFLGGERIPGATAADDIISGGVLADGDPDDLNVDGLHPNADGVDAIVPRIVPQVVELGAAAGLLGGGLELANGSVELWFTPDQVTGEQVLFSKNATGNTAGDIEILLTDDAVLLGMQNGSGTFTSTGGSVAVGDDVHVVVTFGAGGMQLFVNGELVDAAPGFTDGMVGNTDQLGLGARVNGDLPFAGVIDEIAIYDRALTAGEVGQLFEGGEFGTTVVGTADDDMLFGGSAAEQLRGGRGDDGLHGGLGNDELLGGNGQDDLHGGGGDDELDGRDGDDLLAGGEGDDLLEGGDGADSLNGAAGDDRLFGNRGTDDLSGGDDDDLLNGGNGRDDLSGGAGSDIFQIDDIGHGVDKVLDFEDGAGGDVLDLDAVLNFESGDDFEDFVRLTEVNGNAKVEVDGNGGGDDFTAVFNLIGGAGLDIGNLVDDGNVQLTTPTS